MDLKFLENDILCQIFNITLWRKFFKFKKLKSKRILKKHFQKQITKIATKEMDVAHVIPFAH